LWWKQLPLQTSVPLEDVEDFLHLYNSYQ
jgi:hypothetical protein